MGDEKKGKRENLTSKRQQDILEAATRVFARKGFNGATTREIAKEAGVAEGTIFRYFKTKKDILLGLAGPLIVKSLAEVMQDLTGQSDETILREILANRLSIIKQNSDLVRLLFIESQFHPEIKKLFTENIIMKAAGIMENFIAARIDAGVYKDIDPRVAARIFFGTAATFVLWNEFLQADSGLKFDLDSVSDIIVDIYLNGIRKDAGEGEIR